MQDSDIVMTQICVIDNSRFMEHIADVAEEEFITLQNFLMDIIE